MNYYFENMEKFKEAVRRSLDTFIFKGDKGTIKKSLEQYNKYIHVGGSYLEKNFYIFS